MRFSSRRFRGLLASMGVIVAISAGTYAFTASNTVPTTNAGQGTGSISGYTATNVSYSLNATTPTNIDSVSFTINPATTASVKAQLASSGAWYPCSNAAGTVTCATTSPQATVSSTSQLTVVASQ